MLEKRVDWVAVPGDAASLCERVHSVSLDIDRDVVLEISIKTNDTLSALNMNTMPNVAKVAGLWLSGYASSSRFPIPRTAPTSC